MVGRVQVDWQRNTTNTIYEVSDAITDRIGRGKGIGNEEKG